MRKKIIPVLVAIVLIIIIGAVGVGSVLIEKYSYSEERVDPDEYFGVSGEQLAIVLQDEMVEEKAILRDGICYFDIDTVHRYLNEGFYVDRTEGLLLYTTATEIISVPIGSTTVSTRTAINGAAQTEELGYVAVIEEGNGLYLAADM